MINKCLKIILLSAVFAMLTACDATQNETSIKEKNRAYSNVIFFGDSLSDIGNIPQSSILNPEKYPDLSLLSYVPISNPVINIISGTDTEEFQVPGTTDKKNKYKYPDIKLIDSELFKQPLLNGNRRQSRSLSWTQYFVNMAFERGMLKTKSLYPWTRVYSSNFKPADNLYSVDYAWASALAGKDCHNFNFAPIGNNISTKEIYLKQKMFREKSSDKKLLFNIPIPGAARQAEMFNCDLKDKKIYVDSKTLYIIWIGANDISKAFSKLYKTFSIKSFLSFYRQINSTIPDKIAGNNDNSVLYKLIHSNAKPKNIIIMSQFNLGITPEAFIECGTIGNTFLEHGVAGLFSLMTSTFNSSLQDKIKSFKKPNEVSIKFLDLHGRLTNLESDHFWNPLSSPGPFNSKYGKDYLTDHLRQMQKGNAGNALEYLFWNEAHLSSPGQQFIANELLTCTLHL
jgi:phospholipase/lecithinase/hemolysin